MAASFYKLFLQVSLELAMKSRSSPAILTSMKVSTKSNKATARNFVNPFIVEADAKGYPLLVGS